MATITARKQADGKTRFTALIRIRVNGQSYQESRTFSTKAMASAWAKTREDEIRSSPAVSGVKSITIRKLIEAYLSQQGVVLGRSKDSHLRMLLGFSLAEKDAISLTAAQVVEHVRKRRSQGTGASTTMNDLIWLRVVWRYAHLERIPVKIAVLDEAFSFCKKEKLIAKSLRRVRRPTDEELIRIGDWFRSKQRRRNVPPMYQIMWAAIYSCRRLDELFHLRLSDWDRGRGTWLVRDIKHPGGSAGNNREMLVTDRFLAVVNDILALPGRKPEEDLLLPYNSRSIGAYWQRQMQVLGINDLHFHDLRRHGCSLLAEEGKTIPEIQMISLHENWGSLQIYVNMRRSTSRLEFEPEMGGSV